MRLLFTFILLLVLLPVAYSQTTPIYRVVGELDLGGWKQDAVTASKFLSAENMLVLVTRKTIRRWDATNAKFLEPIPIGTEESAESVISPDGHKLLVFGNYKAKHPASIWDLQTGKQIAVLAGPFSKPIRAGYWSRNGKTLVTSSGTHSDGEDNNVEISFWDGETLKFKNSLPTNKVFFWHLTNDGAKCFYTVRHYWPGFGPRMIMPGRPMSMGGAAINIWDTNSGTVDQIITANDENSERQIGGIAFSPDETHLAFITRRPQQYHLQTRLVFLDIYKSSPPKYLMRLKYEVEIESNVFDDDPIFSPDGEYLAINGYQSPARIYDAKTGKLKFDMTRVASGGRYWLIDDKILLFDLQHNKPFALAVSTGRRDYLDDVDYGWTDTGADTIFANPNQDMLMACNAYYVKICDSDTGELLQTIIEPPKDFRGGKLLLHADWSNDGKTIYVIGGDGSKVTIWGMVEK